MVVFQGNYISLEVRHIYNILSTVYLMIRYALILLQSCKVINYEFEKYSLVGLAVKLKF